MQACYKRRAKTAGRRSARRDKEAEPAPFSSPSHSNAEQSHSVVVPSPATVVEVSPPADVVVDAVVVDPAVVDAVVVDPAVVDAAVVDPAVVDPAVDPAVVDPAVVDPAVVDPAVVDPAVVDP